MSDKDQEKTIIEAFSIIYGATRNGIMKGTLTPKHSIELLDQMAGCFRDYLLLQRAEVAALLAIQKAKNEVHSKD